MSILGNRVVRIEDERMITVGGDYVGDLRLDGTAHVAYVTSTMAHARIAGIELDEARAMPGVLGVFTSDDLALRPLGGPGRNSQRPVLASGKVRFVGEPVVAVVAETEAQAIDGAELVVVDYDPLEPLVDPRAALDGPLVHDTAEGNVCLHHDEAPLDLDGCDVVVELDIVNPRVAPCPIEGRHTVATWDGGRLIQWASCQGTHTVRDRLAQTYGLDPSAVRVITPDVGGGFGAKGQPHVEEIALGALSRLVGRPVSWSDPRSQNMTGMVHGRAQYQRTRMGGTADGRITHYELDVTQDGGAYASHGVFLPNMTGLMLTGVYAIDHLAYSWRSVFTTTTPVSAFRGAGRPEAAAAIERTVDRWAAAAGLDPAEVRRRNFIAPDAFPFDTGRQSVYDSGDYERALDLALEAADYRGLRAEQARRRETGDPVQLGIGLSAYVEITAGMGGGEPVSIELRADGSVVVRVGAHPYGQGHDTTWTMLVSDRLGLPFDRIEIRHGDTDEMPEGNVTGGSRSAQIVGSSVDDASERLVDLARRRAADLLEAAVDDIVVAGDGAGLHVTGTPARGVDWAAVAAGGPDPLVGVSTFRQDHATFPFGVHVSVVEVDTETGRVWIRRHVAVDDAGTILNPVTADGQVHGGLAQGIAQALMESVVFDVDGNPLTTNFADYPVISATELPMFDRIEMVTPTPHNPLGAKGIGESATVGATPAVHNAVCDALAPFGVVHVDMPCTPMRVWEAIRSGAGAQG